MEWASTGEERASTDWKTEAVAHLVSSFPPLSFLSAASLCLFVGVYVASNQLCWSIRKKN